MHYIQRHRPSRPSFVQSSLVSAIFAVCASVASAQSPPSPATELDPVVVTATRTPQPLSGALPATTVITRADIEDSQARDLPTLLRGQAGFDVTQQGGIGSQSSLFLRGSNSNQVLVLVDGLRINTSTNGAASVAHLMVDQIDHIEIVRGNVSSLYGSEAIGGVIQIFTRAGATGAAGTSIGAGVTYGSERNRAASVDASQTFGPADTATHVGVSASYRGAKGFSAIDADRVATANPDDDGYRNQSVSATVSQRFGQQEVGLRWFESHGHLDFDDSSDYSYLDPAYNGRVQTHAERSRQTDGAAYAKLKPLDWWTIDLTAGRTRDLSANTSSFPDSFVVGSTTSVDGQYRLGNTFRIAQGQAVTLGYEHLDQNGASTSYGDGIDGASYARKVDSVMAGYTGSLFLPPINEFQFNVRRDRYSDFGGATTGLAAYGITVAPGWKAILQASDAFKAPTFNELYFPFFGNPQLKPEKARSIEAALQYASDRSLVRLSAFETRTRDLIVFDNNLFVANNIARARVKGVELTARTVIDGWSLTGSATFERPIDEATRQPLLRRADRNVGLAVARSFGPVRVTADAQAAGRRADTDILTFARTELPGYAVASFGVRYQVVKNVTAGVAVTNAFDRHYVLVDGYNTAGRVVLGSLEARY